MLGRLVLPQFGTYGRAYEERMKYASFGSCSLAILLSLDLPGWVPPVRAPAAPVSRDDVDTYIDGEMRHRGIPGVA